ncbi:hypothetical protein V2G26_000747 [Clonostachys chloroleuca]
MARLCLARRECVMNLRCSSESEGGISALHPAQPVECRCDVKRVRSIREGPLWWCDSGATTRAEMPMRQMPVGVNKCRLVWSLSYAFMEVSSPVGDRRDEPSD